MKEQIVSRLHEIERREQVRILLAVESGSRRSLGRNSTNSSLPSCDRKTVSIQEPAEKSAGFLHAAVYII